MPLGVGAMNDERREQFTEEELSFLRHVRFGELPPRIRPEERVAITETEPRRDLPEPQPWHPPQG
jgi:hypothetical protein